MVRDQTMIEQENWCLDAGLCSYKARRSDDNTFNLCITIMSIYMTHRGVKNAL